MRDLPSEVSEPPPIPGGLREPSRPSVVDRILSPPLLAPVFLWDLVPLTPVAVGTMHTGVSKGGNEIRSTTNGREGSLSPFLLA